MKNRVQEIGCGKGSCVDGPLRLRMSGRSSAQLKGSWKLRRWIVGGRETECSGCNQSCRLAAVQRGRGLLHYGRLLLRHLRHVQELADVSRARRVILA